MYDREQAKEVNERLGRRVTTERETEMVPLIRMLQAAAVVAQRLMTQSGEWNRFLEILQGRLEALQAAKLNADRLLAGPDVWDAGEIMKLKGDVRVLTGQIEMLRDVMELPVALVNSNKNTQEIIDEFEEKYGNSAGTKKTES